MRKLTATILFGIIFTATVCYSDTPFGDTKITDENKVSNSSFQTKVKKTVGLKTKKTKKKNDENKITQYTVQRGDSLYKISRNLLGKGSRWTEIVELNKDRYPSLITNPALIYAGWVLKMPGSSSSTTIASSSTTTTTTTTTTTSTTNTPTTTIPTTTTPSITTTPSPTSTINNVSTSDYTGVTKVIFDIVKKFCEANEAYVFGSAHRKEDGYVKTSDCSGFTGQFINKLSQLAGVTPVIGNSYPSSTQYAKPAYTQKITSAFPPTNPRDLIKPGDIFVMGKGAGHNCGHVGIFMGYNSAGQPLFAHSTGSATNANAVMGKLGKSGVRVEVLSYSDQIKQRGWGIYRLNNMDQIVKNLENK